MAPSAAQGRSAKDNEAREEIVLRGADLVGPRDPRADMRGAQGAEHVRVSGAVRWETGGLCAGAVSSGNYRDRR